MSNPKWEETIVIAPNNKLFENGTWEGLLTASSADNIALLDHVLSALSDYSIHTRRGGLDDPTPPEANAEINYDFKQPIPYGIITSDDRDGKLRVFVYERLSGGGESRLHNKLSIGVGGHMNTLPAIGDKFIEVVKKEALRELTEELLFESVEGEVNPETYGAIVLGLINDNSDDVGKVHLGVLYTIETNPNHSVTVRETDQLKGEWMTLEELEAVYDRLESWSQIALQALKAAPHA